MKGRIWIWLTGIVIAASIFSTFMLLHSEDSSTSVPCAQAHTEKVDPIAHIMQSMTLHEKICQLFVIYPEAITGASAAVQADPATRESLEKWPVGGFLYDAKNMKSQQQLRQMLDTTQTYAKIPLLFACDEEGGRVTRLMSTVGTTWLNAMLSYKDQGPDIAKENAKTIATDLLSCGFNTDFAPVADVWSNPQNTVIGDRAYSDDFHQAANLIAAAVEGFHEGGAICTLKHFPGHGNTSSDSHYGAVYVYRTLEELRQEELLPFQAGIDAGADMVMMGHLIVSDIDSEPAPFPTKSSQNCCGRRWALKALLSPTVCRCKP